MPGKITKRKKKGAIAMDPVTACANVVTAILNYATEVRRTMTPEARDEFDKIIIADMHWWRRVFHLPES